MKQPTAESKTNRDRAQKRLPQNWFRFYQRVEELAATLPKRDARER